MFANGTTEEQSHVATVTNVDDPDKRGRIKVACAALLGDEQRELPGWIEPALSWGWFAVPDVGQQVTIFVTAGTSTDTFRGQSSITSSNIRWHGATHFTDEDATDPNPVGDEFTGKNYGKRRGFKTPNGHVLLFDDTAGDQQIQMTWAGGDKAEPKTAFWAIDKDGSFMAQDSGGSLFYMNGKDGETSLINQHGGQVILNEAGISLIDQHSNGIVMNENGISFLSRGAMVFMGTDHTFNNGLHFSDGVLSTNVGGICESFNATTANGAAMTATTAANLAIPGAPTWQAQLVALNITAVL